MKVHGYCTECHRIRRVNATPSSLVAWHARGGTPVGVCDECIELDDAARRARTHPSTHRPNTKDKQR